MYGGTLIIGVARAFALVTGLYNPVTSRQRRSHQEVPAPTDVPVPVGCLTLEQIAQYELSPTLPWIGLSPSQYHSSIPWYLENQALDALLNPCQFENADAVENFSISTPRPAMTLSVANAKMQFEQAQPLMK